MLLTGSSWNQGPLQHRRAKYVLCLQLPMCTQGPQVFEQRRFQFPFKDFSRENFIQHRKCVAWPNLGTPSPHSCSWKHITHDGFTCQHEDKIRNVKFIFVIDRSGSMASTDVQPTMVKFSSAHNNWLGCVYKVVLCFMRTRLQQNHPPESVSIVLFNEGAKAAFECKDMKEDLIDTLLTHGAGGGTGYYNAVKISYSTLLWTIEVIFTKEIGPNCNLSDWCWG